MAKDTWAEISFKCCWDRATALVDREQKMSVLHRAMLFARTLVVDSITAKSIERTHEEKVRKQLSDMLNSDSYDLLGKFPLALRWPFSLCEDKRTRYDADLVRYAVVAIFVMAMNDDAIASKFSSSEDKAELLAMVDRLEFVLAEHRAEHEPDELANYVLNASEIEALESLEAMIVQKVGTH